MGCLFCFLQKRLHILALPFPLLISPSEPQERLSSQLKSSIMSPIGEGNGTTLQYSCLENPMDRGAWWAAVHGVTKSKTGLSDFTFTFHFHALEKEMATHSRVLAWRTPGTGEPGGLPSMGSHRVRHDWSNLLTVAAVGSPIKHNESQLLGCLFFFSRRNKDFIQPSNLKSLKSTWEIEDNWMRGCYVVSVTSDSL